MRLERCDLLRPRFLVRFDLLPDISGDLGKEGEHSGVLGFGFFFGFFHWNSDSCSCGRGVFPGC